MIMGASMRTHRAAAWQKGGMSVVILQINGGPCRDRTYDKEIKRLRRRKRT